MQDVLTLHGSQFKTATCIVASPPCQGYSYRAMPWSRAKALPPPDNSLFEACFRIQCEACEAAGRYIPMVVENVRGAQKWVGRAKWHHGSYFLWGDVPGLMPIIPKRGARKVPGFRFDGSGGSFQTAAVKVSGLDWSKHGEPGYKAKGFNVTAAQNYRETQKDAALKMGWDNSEPGKMRRDDGATKGRGSWFGDYQAQKAATDGAIKQGGDWFGKGAACSMSRRFSSKSNSRKAASAEIAKIPFPLASHVARCFRP